MTDGYDESDENEHRKEKEKNILGQVRSGNTSSFSSLKASICASTKKNSHPTKPSSLFYMKILFYFPFPPPT